MSEETETPHNEEEEPKETDGYVEHPQGPNHPMWNRMAIHKPVHPFYHTTEES